SEKTAAMREPSSGGNGIRLKRLSRKPTFASAIQYGLPVPAPMAAQASAARRPAAGPPAPLSDSIVGSFGNRLRKITAPRNGMNIGAVAFRPFRQFTKTWQSSWIKIENAKPTAN